LPGQCTNICTFPEEPDAIRHHLTITAVIHSNHVVAAFLAYLDASKTLGDALFGFLTERMILVMHSCLSYTDVIKDRMGGW
jgi:hypothetical protein